MSQAVKERFYPVAMTIAGSDSGGGAGVAADLRTFNALGVFGTCAITAVTAQNPAAVRRIDPIPASGVAAQIEAVLENIAVSYCKSGMLFAAETVSAVAETVAKHHLKLVCDPVMVSTSGSRLMQDDAIATAKKELLPLASWLTPNIPEAELLLETGITGETGMIAAAKKLASQYQCAVWLKGGHADSANCVDIIVKEGKTYTLTTPRLEVPPFASHGTGCTLSAALAATLALGMPWKQAVCESRAFVYGSLAQCVPVGKKIHAMYPPVEDSIQLVKLTAAE